LAYAAAYSWKIATNAETYIWGGDVHTVVIDPSGQTSGYSNKSFFYTDYYPGYSWAGMTTDPATENRAEVWVRREENGSNDNASAWMRGSGGAEVRASYTGDATMSSNQNLPSQSPTKLAEVKASADGNATMSTAGGATVKACANGDVEITLGD
jgi:hypothetical protein